jgi:UDP-N-acetylglucosamine 2-epimerase (non-hydrolysing)
VTRELRGKEQDVVDQPHGEVLVVIGTRPEAVKLAGVVRALGERARIAHTGQHYDVQMWHAVTGDVGLPEPDARITVGGSHRGEQIGTATAALTAHLLDQPAKAVIVQGDTNSTLAGALAGNATGTPVVHVEAGLRSDDLSMPEESNRLLVDRVADLCCAPTSTNAERLRREGVRDERIAVTGNTLFDALATLLPAPAQAAAALARHGVTDGRYVLATIHRSANVDDVGRLARLVDGLAALATSAPVLLPLHPRTRAAADRAGLRLDRPGLLLLPPLGPVDFLALEAGAGLIVSDSGGVQEEACFLRRPLLVLRDSTERPELLDGWCELLGDRDPVAVLAQAWKRAADWARSLRTLAPPYDAAGASQRVVEALDRLLSARAAAARTPAALLDPA